MTKGSVLVTGGAKGIGRATAIAFAKAGYRVSICYRTSEQAALELRAQMWQEGYDFSIIRADVTDAEQVANMVADIGRIDILVNNAGISSAKPFLDTTIADWRAISDACTTGAYLCSHAVLPQMLARQSGSIVNISSIWGLCGASCEVIYSASKSALIGMTKALAKELGPSGIRVNAIAPGVIATDMLSEYSAEDLAALASDTPLGRIGTPEDVASAVLFLAEHPFITGECLNVSGGFVI